MKLLLSTMFIILSIFIFIGWRNNGVRYEYKSPEPIHVQIQNGCNDKELDEYTKQECRIYKQTLNDCRKETPGTEPRERCIGTLNMCEYNVKNALGI